MAILEKQQKLLLSDEIKAINKALPYELIVDIFNAITVEEFWSIFYPFYIRDKFSTDSEGEMLKEHNTTTKNTKEPFEKWSECIKNWLGSSAIIYIFERETFKKRHKKQMEFIHLVQTIEAQNTTITNLEGQVAEQATTIANQAARIAFLEGQVVGQATTIANQAARITFLEGQVGEQAVNIPNQAARIVNLDNASKMMITIVFIFNENSFYEIEDERAATCYIARIPFRKTLADFFTVQYCEITVPDIFKFKYIGFSKDGVADIRMTNTSTKKIYRVKFSCTTETAKNEDFTHALVPFDASIQFTAGCALVSPPKNYSSEPQCFLFFTVNGRFIGNAIGLEKNIEELFPIFMLSEDNVQVTSKFGDNDFIYKIGKTFVEDWLKFK